MLTIGSVKFRSKLLQQKIVRTFDSSKETCVWIRALNDLILGSNTSYVKNVMLKIMCFFIYFFKVGPVAATPAIQSKSE